MTSEWLQRARDQWTNRGQKRPDFAIEPEPGQESVWDYPRPPAVVADDRHIVVRSGATLIADSHTAGSDTAGMHSPIRVLETSHPPSFYLPPDSVVSSALVVVAGSSHCEWKGRAEYLGLATDSGADGPAVGWRYPSPYPEFEQYAGYVSFYPSAVRCFVNDEPVRPQAGGFYGGWITSDVVGPFKGEPGTSGW